MAENSMKSVEFDADALRAEIRKVRPERVTYQEILEEMASLLKEKVAEGASVKALADALARQGLRVGERSLKAFLDTGKLPERKSARAKTPAPENLPNRPAQEERYRAACRKPGNDQHSP